MSDMYSVRLVQFVLRNYQDISAGHLPGERLEALGGKPASNPAETALVLASDCDRALDNLTPGKRWTAMIRDTSFAGIRFNANKMPPIQRSIIKLCIMGECGEAECRHGNHELLCYNIDAIKKMKRFLNGQANDNHSLALARGRAALVEAVRLSSPRLDTLTP